MEEIRILEIEHGDGSKTLRAMIEFFASLKGNTYAVLLPLNEDGTTSGDADFEIVRAKPVMNEHGLEDYEIESIPNEEEMNAVSEELRAKWAAANNEEDLISDAIEQEEYEIVEVTDDKGEKFDCYIADVFQAQGRTYAALFRVSEEDKDGGTYYLFRAEHKKQDKTEGVEIFPIVSDMEFEEVKAVFEEERLSLLF